MPLAVPGLCSDTSQLCPGSQGRQWLCCLPKNCSRQSWWAAGTAQEGPGCILLLKISFLTPTVPAQETQPQPLRGANINNSASTPKSRARGQRTVIKKKARKQQYCLSKLRSCRLCICLTHESKQASVACLLLAYFCDHPQALPEEPSCRRVSGPRAALCGDCAQPRRCCGVPALCRCPGTGLSSSRAQARHRDWAAEMSGHLDHYKQPVIIAVQELCDIFDLLLCRPQAIKVKSIRSLVSFLLVYMLAAARGGPGRLKFTELVVSAGVISPAH